ncbi:MAG: M15 family metallopeptidase [Dysgonamonadaceae bacterium]|nr:M15 family metallopeptidase [Dysgonamonadaceae bacterium]MDD4727133.1 M15 family metallopeptidase [Dysgonamonadaceae bacterium]
MRYFLLSLFTLALSYACHPKQSKEEDMVIEENNIEKEILEEPDTTIIDSRYTFDEAIEGSNAPQKVIDELHLINVTYLSTDNKLHQGQILTNKRLAQDIKEIFQFMLEQNFVIERAIPIVAYNWSDSLSMANNNTYSFCYRNITYSNHAKGLAIDINPRFNPLRWKTKDLPNEPIGAVLDTTVNGTLHPEHLVVKEFRKRGFRWGHTFTKYWDDHHFERK